MFCFKIVAVLGMHFCDPNQLIATKQRNKLAAANKALCYLTRGSFKEDQHTQASLTCVCLSLRLFVRNVWLEIALKKQQRESEGEDDWLGSSLSSEPRGLTGLSVASHAGVLTRSKISGSLLHRLSRPWHGLGPGGSSTVINDTAQPPNFLRLRRAIDPLHA